jgi:hypothetical protein
MSVSLAFWLTSVTGTGQLGEALLTVAPLQGPQLVGR